MTFVERDNVGYQDDIKTATKDTGTLQKTGPLDERISINKGGENAQLSSCKPQTDCETMFAVRSAIGHSAKAHTTQEWDAIRTTEDITSLQELNRSSQPIGLPMNDDRINIRAIASGAIRCNKQDRDTRHTNPGPTSYRNRNQGKIVLQAEGRAESSTIEITPDEHSMRIPVRDAGCQFAISNLVPPEQINQLDMTNPEAVLTDSDTTISPNILTRPPAEKPGHGTPELRTHFERRFAGKRFTPHSTRWVAQQIYERDVPAAIGILSTWTHHRRRVEVTEAAIAQLNTLSDYDSILAIQEMRSPRRYIQGGKGNQLTMDILLSTTNNDRIIETDALLDCGCTGSTIHTEFVKKHNLPTKTLPRPLPVYNADGTLNRNGAIKETTTLRMIIQDHEEEITFAISDLGSANVYIGHEWLKRHNPDIDWKNARVFMDRCPHTCTFLSGSQIDSDNSDTETLVEEEDEEELLSEGDRLFVFDIDSYLESQSITINKITQINRNNYDYILKYDAEKSKSKQWNEVVPPQYHDYEDIFTKKDFDKLPERRPWDHAIELTPGFRPVDCKTYPLSPKEQGQLKEFIDENLRTGRIRPSTSPMASPFFFVKKKDGALRPTQDYRKLNDATIKNRYPLPLISELIDKLGPAKIFSKMDVRWGYNNIRIKEGDEWKAAFRTNYGLFEPTVMFFGLTNSPATFQNFMNHIFKPLIDQGVVAVYMDDILIFTQTHEEHTRVVREVLHILRENNLFLKPEKCVFHQPEVEYLGLIVGNRQARMDPAKVAAIRDWPAPTKKQELQRFLGFCNFYRHFIKDYSKIAKPLTILTGDIPWTWTDHQQHAFNTLINAITTEPVLALPQPRGQFRLEADSSDYAVGAVLSQIQNEKWHPIAYLSKALTETQRNYEIYDKEMLAIMLALDEWRHYLIGAEEPFEIWTDHQNLQYFRQPQKVNRRQARWIIELANYHFTLHHKPGTTHTKPDFLSRPPGLDKGENDNKDVVLLPPQHFRALHTQIDLHNAEYILTDDPFQQSIKERLSHIEREHYDGQVIKALATQHKDWYDHGDGIITYQERIYIPSDPIRIDIIREHHDSQAAGHPGRFKTQELITRSFWWPRIGKDIRKYIDGCDACQRTKTHHDKPHNPLHPNEIPEQPWEHITIDLITGLPESDGYNAILVIVDRFSKMIILIPTNDTLDALQTAQFYRDRVWNKHGLPRKVISDRGTQFVSQFMNDLHKLVGVRINPSTAFHPQTNGQTE